MAGENGYDRMSGDEELGEEKLTQISNGQKRSRHEFEVDSDDGQYESGEMPTNGKDVCLYLDRFCFMISMLFFFFCFFLLGSTK